MTIYPTSFYCFSCQKSGDIFDLIQQTERISKNKVIQYAAKKYGIHIDNTAKREENIDYTSFYRECNKHLQDTNYHRGISLETLNRFLVGYAAQWQHPKAPQSQPTPRLIIPTSKTSYLARDTRKTAEISENQKNYTKSKVGSVHIFNEKALQVNDIVYIVEGELDTLSIIDVGGNAVGLGSVSNINSFFKAIDCNGRAKQQKFIISLDNDKIGEKYKNALIEGLHKRCIKYCVYNPSGNYKDSNESLMNNREEFSKSVKYGIENIDRLIDEYKQQKNLDYNRKYSAKILFEDFIDGIADSVNTEVVPTGFKAISSLTQPKTTIFSFILDNNYFNLNFPQKYLTCLICYENINKYKELYDTYQIYINNDENNNKEEIQMEKLEENLRDRVKSLTEVYAKKEKLDGILGPKFNEKKNMNKNIKDENIYIPKCLMIMSLFPYFAEYEKILTEIYNYSLIVDDEAELRKQKTLDIASIVNRGLNTVKQSQTVANLENHIKKPNSQILIPIDKIIENLLIELPVPPRGIFEVEYTLINKEKKLKQNLMNELPLVDINLKRLFTFDIKEIVDMYHNLFLESRILFFSEDIQ